MKPVDLAKYVLLIPGAIEELDLYTRIGVLVSDSNPSITLELVPFTQIGRS